jgi:hypothetical protein
VRSNLWPNASYRQSINLSDGNIHNQGPPPDFNSLIRISYLLGQHQICIQQIQFSDAKAATLIAAIALMAASGLLPATKSVLGHPLLAIGAILAALSQILCILAIWPRYPSRSERTLASMEDSFSWPTLAGPGFDRNDYAAFVTNTRIHSLIAAVARSNVAVAAILLRKSMALRMAFVLGVLFMVLVYAYHVGLK